MPESCLQLPERTQACPNLIYKRAKVDVPIIAAKTRKMICICLSELMPLRIRGTRAIGQNRTASFAYSYGQKTTIRRTKLIELNT
jgi:hypothetical protein